MNPEIQKACDRVMVLAKAEIDRINHLEPHKTLASDWNAAQSDKARLKKLVKVLEGQHLVSDQINDRVYKGQR